MSSSSAFVFQLPYYANLLIQRKPVEELERPQTILDSVGKRLADRVGNVHTRSALRDTCCVKRLRSAAQRADRLAKSEGVDQNLQRTTGRIKRCRRGRVRRLGCEAARSEESFGTVGHDNGVEVGRVRVGVERIDSVRERLGNNGDNDIRVRERVAETLALADAVWVANSGKDTDFETVDPLERRAKGTHVGRLVVVIVRGIGLGLFNANGPGNPAGEVVVDTVELGDDILPDHLALDVGVLETDGVDEELLLCRHQRVVEQPWL